MPSEPAQSLPDHCSCAAPGIPQAAIDAMIAAAAEPIHDDGHTDCYYAGLLIAALPYVSPETARLRAENERYREAIKTALDTMAVANDEQMGPGGVARKAYAHLWHEYFAIPAGIKRSVASDEQEATG